MSFYKDCDEYERATRPTPADADQEKRAEEPSIIEDLDPWPDHVDGASLAEEIRDLLTGHVVFSAKGDPDAAVLWVLGSYLMDTWRLWPRLLVTSPTRACGKSTLLKTIEAVSHRALIVSNATSSVIFRSIEAWQPTLLLDEADTWARQDEGLAGILNSGHTRRTASVMRNVEVGGRHEPTRFSTWAPLVIAGIGSQRDTLESRSIRIGLRRKLSHETVERMPIDFFDRKKRVREQALRWAQDSAVSVGAADVEPPDCGDDRRRDNYTPLWRIAHVLGGHWPDRIAAAYLAAQPVDEVEEPAGVQLLQDLHAMFEAHGENKLGRTFVLAHLATLEDRPWPEWRHGKPISANGVTRLLKPFGIVARKVWFRGDSVQGYRRDGVMDAFIRYAGASTPAKIARLPEGNENNDVTMEKPHLGDEPKTKTAMPNPLKKNDSGGLAKNKGVRPRTAMFTTRRCGHDLSGRPDKTAAAHQGAGRATRCADH